MICGGCEWIEDGVTGDEPGALASPARPEDEGPFTFGFGMGSPPPG